MQALVIGYGNRLRGDDGAGWEVALALGERYPEPEVRVLTVRQLTPELAEAVGRADTVVFVDASLVTAWGRVEAMVQVPAEDTPRCFTHHCDPGMLLALARDVYGRTPTAWLLTVGAREFELEEQLSEPVRAAIPLAVARAAALIEGAAQPALA